MVQDLPLVIGFSGAVPRDIEEIRETLLTQVAATNPGYTANLPGILIEDISSTDTLAIAQCDSARVETINSLTPLGANAFLLLQLGQMLGIPVGTESFTSVFVVFSTTPAVPGVVLGKGFIISDGTYQYALVNGSITKADGKTDPLQAVATRSGVWAVPPGSVNRLTTSPPPGVNLTVTNPNTGTPGTTEGLSQAAYRARVLQANLAASQGMVRYLRTLLSNVPGVQDRLVLPLLNPYGDLGQWKIIVGGSGDPYQIASAIYTALFDVSSIVGSVTHVVGITSAMPAHASTDINHGFQVGDGITFFDSNPVDFNGSYTVSGIISPTVFTYGTPYPAISILAAAWDGTHIEYTTNGAHTLVTGNTVHVSSCTPSAYNGTYVCTVTGANTFTVLKGVDPGTFVFNPLGQLNAGYNQFNGTLVPAYVDNGIVLGPNTRNVTVSIQDYPDTYTFPFVNPPEQSVHVVVTWNTITTNIVSPIAVAQAVQPMIADYINSVVVGKPMNLLQMQDAFHDAVENLLTVNLISSLTFDVSLNGIPVSPVGQLIFGDPESFFFAEPSDITVVKTL
jgi:hypothetical protein